MMQERELLTIDEPELIREVNRESQCSSGGQASKVQVDLLPKCQRKG